MSNSKPKVIGMSLFTIVVCSPWGAAKTLEWVCRTNPAGTMGNWHPATRTNQLPVQCAKYKTKKHYMFVC